MLLLFLLVYFHKYFFLTTEHLHIFNVFSHRSSVSTFFSNPILILVFQCLGVFMHYMKAERRLMKLELFIKFSFHPHSRFPMCFSIKTEHFSILRGKISPFLKFSIPFCIWNFFWFTILYIVAQKGNNCLQHQ